MTTMIWLIGLAAFAFASWNVAAFLLRLRHTGRLVATLVPPAIIVGTRFWAWYLETGRVQDAGWDAVFAVVSLFVAGFTVIAVLPIWFLAEEKLGWRAR